MRKTVTIQKWMHFRFCRNKSILFSWVVIFIPKLLQMWTNVFLFWSNPSLWDLKDSQKSHNWFKIYLQHHKNEICWPWNVPNLNLSRLLQWLWGPTSPLVLNQCLTIASFKLFLLIWDGRSKGNFPQGGNFTWKVWQNVDTLTAPAFKHDSLNF